MQVSRQVCHYSGLSGVKVATLGTHGFTSLVEWYKRWASHVAPGQLVDRSIFSDSPSICFYLWLRSKTYHFEHTLVKGWSNGTRGEPRTVTVWHQRYKKTSKTHIQSKAMPTLHALGIGWHMRFQSSSPCSIVHGTTQACKHIHFQKQI